MAALRSLLLLGFVLLALVLGLLIGIDNSAPVSLAFLDWTSPALPLFVWVCVALIIGFLVGIGLTAFGVLRLRHARSRLEKDLAASRRELERLRGHGG